ncbi:MAG: tRNA 4-thiouridine(8) synthase ThiI [Clostridia bacterium]|nr:tRNA 4-thiouridine(8) synthase ThiI [Clostridia bacterium]
MKEIILCKYGEVVLKGLNKASFEHMMAGELKKRLQTVGPFSVYYRQSTLYAEPLSSDCDVNEAFEIAKKLFGISTVSRALAVEKDLNSILEGAKEYLPPLLEGHSSFKVEGKRADKTFPMTSPELSGEVGAAILEVMPDIKVRMDNPDVIVHVEIREEYAFLHAGSERGAGGMPPRSNGRALLLLSGGIDSPVAGYMMAKRGAGIVALYFESIPYTSELAREKVMTLAEELAQYTGKMTVNVAGITRLQEVIRDNTNEEYFTVLLRRSMMRIATRCAKEQHCLALITGESLGQVASQTMNALAATDSVTDLPVFRPCIGMDKEEIVKLARQIGTFDTSILPYEDCCTVFTPRHPKTRPTIEKVLEEERKIPDLEKLEDEAFNSIYTKNIIVYEW